MLSGLMPPSAADLAGSQRRQGTRQSTVPAAFQESANAVTRAAVAQEYASLRHQGHCPTGIYLIPSADTLLVWDAVFFVHKGYYADAVLRFRISFPANYPDRPPVVHFVTDVFHPLISPQDASFNLSPRFRTWRPKEDHVFHVLHWIKAAFKKDALDQIHESDCPNKEAYRLYHESTQSFAALAAQTSKLSSSPSALYDDNQPSSRTQPGIPFRTLKPEKAAELRRGYKLQQWEDSQG